MNDLAQILIPMLAFAYFVHASTSFPLDLGRTITLAVNSSTTIDEITFQISEKTGIPESMQVLFFLGPLHRNNKLQDYNIQPNSTLHLTHRIIGGLRHKCSMASCKVAGVFQCTNCVCAKSKSCNKKCACRGLCRAHGTDHIEENVIVEEPSQEIYFTREDQTMPFPVHQPTSAHSVPSYKVENKTTSVRSTSLATRAFQLIVFVSLFVIFCQQAILLNEAWNEKIEEFFVSKEHYYQFCENKKLTNQRFAEECSRLNIIINTSPFMNAITKLVFNWKSCILMPCTDLISDLCTFSFNKLVLALVLFFGIIWLASSSFSLGEKKETNLQDYFQAKLLRKRLSRDLSPLELKNSFDQQEQLHQLRLSY